MKKVIYSFFAMAIAAMTMTSCEDVPAPYDYPNNNGGNNDPATTYEPEGDGTLENPFNAAGAIAYASQLESGQESDKDIYIKGKVVSIREQYSTQYGNATFYISQDGTANQQFYIYRALYLGNKKYTNGDLLNEGDDVVVCGRITNYNGTYETQQNKAFLYSLNGKSEGGNEQGGGDVEGTAKGSGTQADPFNVVAALKYIYAGQNLDKEVYVKGKISSIDDINTTQYGNATYNITDADNTKNELKIFRGYSLGNEKFTEQDEIKVGDEVVVVGKLLLYQGNTPEMGQGNYIVLLNGKDSKEPETVNTGTYDNPIDVLTALKAGDAEGAWVKGYIVGYVSGDNISTAVFGASGATNLNILIANSADVKDASKCIVVNLPRGEIRSALNLKDNASVLGSQVLLTGNLVAMYGTRALNGVKYAELNGKSYGSKP